VASPRVARRARRAVDARDEAKHGVASMRIVRRATRRGPLGTPRRRWPGFFELDPAHGFYNYRK